MRSLGKLQRVFRRGPLWAIVQVDLQFRHAVEVKNGIVFRTLWDRFLKPLYIAGSFEMLEDSAVWKLHLDVRWVCSASLYIALDSGNVNNKQIIATRAEKFSRCFDLRNDPFYRAVMRLECPTMLRILDASTVSTDKFEVQVRGAGGSLLTILSVEIG